MDALKTLDGTLAELFGNNPLPKSRWQKKLHELNSSELALIVSALGNKDYFFMLWDEDLEGERLLPDSFLERTVSDFYAQTNSIVSEYAHKKIRHLSEKEFRTLAEVYDAPEHGLQMILRLRRDAVQWRNLSDPNTVLEASLSSILGDISRQHLEQFPHVFVGQFDIMDEYEHRSLATDYSDLITDNGEFILESGESEDSLYCQVYIVLIPDVVGCEMVPYVLVFPDWGALFPLTESFLNDRDMVFLPIAKRGELPRRKCFKEGIDDNLEKIRDGLIQSSKHLVEEARLNRASKDRSIERSRLVSELWSSN